ncbi:protein-L-isoaspartate O-methyltransferase [Lipingzhangella halophila]|uniref:Protein-L-isoaspartate O-methyltransferase n=1 Tax=Lipingzhangella halophila TaxID=1783352 RepID=A0A7W7RK39_9ACTN|nr:methyltransferase domain-containing protein [Lipingzhangella halophila]MBB4933410.1 protein-L-isoaspartate O-methyltransferase [Lipingzhangella halophila]
MTDDLAELEKCLLDAGVLTPAWAGAFQAVPRSLFLPDLVWPFDPDTGQTVTVDRRDDPDAWNRWAEADAPITIQWDDGQHEGTDPGYLYTSSASMPSIVFRMLRDLDVYPGMRVLEVGTGTGWNAALLSSRLDSENVTTVELDEQVATRARTNLIRAGYSPTLVTGDGAAGCLAGAPYDRVIVTYGTRRVSPAWIEQTRPGGIILAPWGTDYSVRDALARLVVADDGASASGPLVRPAQFMKARDQRLSWPRHEEYVTDWPGETSTTTLPLGVVTSGDPYGLVEFALGLLVPDCAHGVHDQGDEVNVWFFGLTDRSWALVRYTGDEEADVHQSGPRRLWDEVEAAYRWWDNADRPGWGRLGLTVTADGEHRIWVDEPSRVLPRG